MFNISDILNISMTITQQILFLTQCCLHTPHLSQRHWKTGNFSNAIKELSSSQQHLPFWHLYPILYLYFLNSVILFSTAVCTSSKMVVEIFSVGLHTCTWIWNADNHVVALKSNTSHIYTSGVSFFWYWPTAHFIAFWDKSIENE